jgi:hypothetical protein
VVGGGGMGTKKFLESKENKNTTYLWGKTNVALRGKFMFECLYEKIRESSNK